MYLSGLSYYPVKSCRGLNLQTASVDARGIANDRLLMVVDTHGHFLTQRELPRMCLITPDLHDGELSLTAPGMEPVHLPVSRSGPTRNVVVWRDSCPAVDQGDAAAAWLSRFLDTPVRLVCIPDGFQRSLDARYAPRGSDQTAFSDGFPLLLISTASLADLNKRLGFELPMNRFRPNLVVHGCLPYDEDRWQRIRIGALEFDVVKPCSRCAITTTDQNTAERAKEPLRTLATYRKVGSDVFFGQNVVHAETGTLSIGDAVAVVSMAG